MFEKEKSKLGRKEAIKRIEQAESFMVITKSKDAKVINSISSIEKGDAISFLHTTITTLDDLLKKVRI